MCVCAEANVTDLFITLTKLGGVRGLKQTLEELSPPET